MIMSDWVAEIERAKSRTLIAAKTFTRRMTESYGYFEPCCWEAMDEVMDAADQLLALEAFADSQTNKLPDGNTKA